MHVVFYKDRFAIELIKEKGNITNKEYREITGLSDEGARKDLNDLLQRELIKKVGKGRNAHYVLNYSI